MCYILLLEQWSSCATSWVFLQSSYFQCTSCVRPSVSIALIFSIVPGWITTDDLRKYYIKRWESDDDMRRQLVKWERYFWFGLGAWGVWEFCWAYWNPCACGSFLLALSLASLCSLWWIPDKCLYWTPQPINDTYHQTTHQNNFGSN